MLSGLAVSAGVAIGPAHLVESGFEQVPEYRLEEADLAGERERFAEALAKSRRQIKKLKAKAQALPEQAAEDIGYLLDAHAAILSGSRLLRGVETRIAEERVNAEYAVQSEIGSIAAQFAAMDDSYLAGRDRRHPRGRVPADPQPDQAPVPGLGRPARRQHHPGRGDHPGRHRADGSAPGRWASPPPSAAPRATPR